MGAIASPCLVPLYFFQSFFPYLWLWARLSEYKKWMSISMFFSFFSHSHQLGNSGLGGKTNGSGRFRKKIATSRVRIDLFSARFLVQFPTCFPFPCHVCPFLTGGQHHGTACDQGFLPSPALPSFVTFLFSYDFSFLLCLNIVTQYLRVDFGNGVFVSRSWFFFLASWDAWLDPGQLG